MDPVLLQFGDGSGWNTDAVIVLVVLALAVIVAVHVTPATVTALVVARTKGLDLGRAFRLGLLAGAANLSAVLLVSLFRVFFGGPFSPSSGALLAFFLVSTITSAVLARRLVVRPCGG